ncbi:MAG: diaminopimelate decarboxylase/aspartate kinase [Myxococcota bacterium]|jgi:diaminopimelate decarboxylase/aspartate kinase
MLMQSNWTALMSSDNRSFTVLKFGGTSVADAGNWRRIARMVRDARAQAEHPVLVCSAVAGVTDRLERLVAVIAVNKDPSGVLVEIERLHSRLGAELGVDAVAVLRSELAVLDDLATSGITDPSAKWQAQVLSMGELMSTRLAAGWLESTGLRARWVDARGLLRARRHSGEPALSAYLSAECDYAPSAETQARLRSEEVDVTITQGFIASNCNGETVLLGRGGSDTSAAYVAAILEADRLEVWTDVPGLFTSDPRHAATARLVPRVTYDEAAVLGSLGAKVLHPRCLPPLTSANIPLHIRWTRHPEVAGTVINGGTATPGVRGVTARDKLCLVVMRRPRRWQPVGFMASVASCFERHQISMDLVASSTSEIRATIDLAANPSAAGGLSKLMADLGLVCEPEIHREVMCVSIVGTAISSALEHVSECLSLFTEPTIHLVTHAADDSHLSFVLDRTLGPALVAAVHDALFAPGRGSVSLGARWSSLQAAPEGKLSPAARAVLRPLSSPPMQAAP